MKKCLYCKKVITKESKEHIIQNALGGQYESADICCPACNNNIISKKIDKEFTKTFNGILDMIPDMVKTNNKKSKPSCIGYASCDEKIYKVIIKEGTVVSCKEWSNENRQEIDSTKFTILGYEFPIENKCFKNGFCKIAFNYAVDKGIDPEILLKNVNIQKDKSGDVASIDFNYRMIPFYPLNPVDSFIELDTEMELYHNLILFSQDNYLWCYVDLFNTFQYYIQLSDEWNGETIYYDYMQLLQRLDHEIPDVYIRRPKDILFYAQFYKIEPTLDVDEFKKRVAKAVQSASVKIDMNDIMEKIPGGYLGYAAEQYKNDSDGLKKALECIPLYFNEDDTLKCENFRQVTITDSFVKERVSYPLEIKRLLDMGLIQPADYTYLKFDRLNHFLSTLSAKKGGCQKKESTKQ